MGWFTLTCVYVLIADWDGAFPRIIGVYANEEAAMRNASDWVNDENGWISPSKRWQIREEEIEG